MDAVRPTLRCLTDDLLLRITSIDDPLDEFGHPLLEKAREQFIDAGTPHERIRAVEDEVLFKVKVQRWRGAVWVDQEQPWLVAAGRREAGSTEDFYEALENEAVAARKAYNAQHASPLTTKTRVTHLLPTSDDQMRYQLEASVRFVRRLERLVPDLVRDSLRDGHEHTAELESFSVGAQVRADHGHETYVAIRITGSVPAKITPIILDIVPGCDSDGWYPETRLPHRVLRPNEQAWSNIMDPAAAAKLLDND